jgi:penicillin-binding protein 1A
MLANALAQSRNIPTVHLMNYLGIDQVIARAHQLGITSEIEATSSAALGASCVHPVELARVYAAFQRRGRTVDVSSIATIYDQAGNIVMDRQNFSVPDWSSAARLARLADPPGPAEFGVSPEVAYIVSRMLRRVVTSGTAHELPDEWKLGGKTGTTNQYDGWFVGFDGELTAVAWVGSDKNTRPLGRGEHGATAAMPIFENFYAHYFTPEPAFWQQEPPERIVWERIDPRSGLRAQPGQPGVDLPFIRGSAPTEFAPTRGTRQAERIDLLSQQF